MKIEFDKKEKAVVIDGRYFYSSFQIQKELLDIQDITSKDWSNIIRFFYDIDHDERQDT